MRKVTLRKILYMLLVSLLISSCGSDVGENWKRKQPAFGPVNQVNILMDKDLWGNTIGDTIRYYMETPYPLLLSAEPEFDLRYVSAEDLQMKRMIKNLRTYLILINLQDEDSGYTKLAQSIFTDQQILEDGQDYVIKIGRDKWADGQLLIFVLAKNEDALMEAFHEYYPTIAARIKEFDNRLIEKDIYVEGHNKVLNEEIKENFGLEIDLNGGYLKAIQNDTFGWYRNDKTVATSSILISVRDYYSVEQLEKDYLKNWMNTVTKKFVEGGIDGSYMRINDVHMPLIMESKTVNNHYTKILRGIWEMNIEFMGGTLVSYVYVDEKNHQLYLIEGFLLAPGEEKRNHMQRLEYIIKNVKLP